MAKGNRSKDHTWYVVKGEIISPVPLKVPYSCTIQRQAKTPGRCQLKTLNPIYSAGTCFQEGLGGKEWRGNEKHPCQGQI